MDRPFGRLCYQSRKLLYIETTRHRRSDEGVQGTTNLIHRDSMHVLKRESKPRIQKNTANGMHPAYGRDLIQALYPLLTLASHLDGKWRGLLTHRIIAQWRDI